VETKHGRIAQLAILGHLVTTAGYRLPTSHTPGYDRSSTPTGLAALSALPSEANWPVAAALAPAPATALHHAQTTLAALGAPLLQCRIGRGRLYFALARAVHTRSPYKGSSRTTTPPTAPVCNGRTSLQRVCSPSLLSDDFLALFYL
jgi:hypothetical protein